jgi:hypothetical protein
MFENKGEISIEECDDANIPVNIFITTPEENKENGETEKWTLHADNFMPRKGRCGGETSYHIEADTREELNTLIAKYIIPLYISALNKLNGMAKGTFTHLYYWNDNK